MDFILILMLVGSFLGSKEWGTQNTLSVQVTNNVFMIDKGYAEESPEIDSSRYMMQVPTSCFVSFCFWNEHLIYMHAHIYRALDKIAYHASTPLISCMPFVEGIEAFTLQGHKFEPSPC